MQTAGRHPHAATCAIHNIASRKVVSERNGQAKAHCGSFGSRNAFLTHRFRDISPQYVSSDPNDNGKNCITKRNYLYLRDSYYRYAELLGVVPKHDAGQSYGDGIVDLYHRLDKIVGQDVNVNIESLGNNLRFTLWQQHNWGEYNLYWFPVKFVMTLPPQLQRITIVFLHLLVRGNGIPTMNGTDLAEYALDWIETNMDDPACDERDEMRSVCNSYREGEAIAALRKIETADDTYTDLKAEIAEYEPVNDVERQLIEIIRKGCEFVRNGSQSIMQYAYDPHYEEVPEFDPIRLDQLIMIVYDNLDTVSEYMLDILNGSATESYEIIPCTALEISPATERPFSMDDYPERFFGWADEFISFIHSYYK